MPKPMHRSRSFKRSDRITLKGRHVVHFKRAKNEFPHCAICRVELNGISINSKKGGRSRRTNSRLFGGVLCANCTADVVKLGSRVEQGEMKLDDISIRQRAYVLQLVAH
ncbi:MAG: 50S ribosomal protein L34e [Candidatus Micrarchaeota archaeon]|nr:50S ribosomal protein L34e [Candidatus Micrarchaeota archaeon]